MPNQNYQRHTFLGGEVSPSLYERADMDKFSKWFSKAENIRFFETGGFRNRPGFVKIANTKNNAAGETIKLLSFSFNDEESFLVELGSGYARFYKNGNPIIVNGEVYEIETPFTTFDEDDIKYAQAGDIIFLTHPQYGIYELARKDVNGTFWEIKKFNTDIYPMLSENEDKSKTLTGATANFVVKQVSIALPNTSSQYYLNVSFTYNDQVVYTASRVSQEFLVEGIRSALVAITSTLSVRASDGYLYIEDHSSPAASPSDFSITYTYEYTESATVSNSARADTGTGCTSTVSYAQFSKLDSLYVYHYGFGNEVSTTVPLAGYATIEEALAAINGIYSFSNKYTSSPGVLVDYSNQTIYHRVNRVEGSGALVKSALRLTGQVPRGQTITNNSSVASSVPSEFYTITATDPLFFESQQVGDVFLIKQDKDASILNGTYSSTITLGPVLSDGNWRLYTTGNWSGKIELQYSSDNKATWVNYTAWTSEDSSQPYNINTSGTVDYDDSVWFRAKITMSSGSVKFFFSGASYTTNSYYKIMFKNSSTSVIAQCIKNDVGEFADKFTWRLPAFSRTEGYPQTIGFYQNRLFFGKDYILYGSKADDFWDFYEPIKLEDDDPVTMSLLSTKVNRIQNIVTQRSFFTFTGGGEFGIGSEGALTQSDKYLKPFSSNGSAKCLPVLVSDVVLFVDKSYNSVRALKYSLESDGYEAPDITLTLRYLLRNERIVSTDQIFEEKEALFLSDTGIVWVLKYITDQNVLSWSHWTHAFGKITNICVVPNGHKHDLYIAVEYSSYKWIEKLDASEFCDTVEYYNATSDNKINVSNSEPGDVRLVIQNGIISKETVDENGQINTPSDHTAGFKIGSQYISTATLLSPVIQEDDYSHSTYRKKNPFKVHYYYTDSYGFSVGVEGEEKMLPSFSPYKVTVEEETNLTSGKESVLIPSRFDGCSRVSFVQDKPYPMEIQDVLVETDFGGQ